MTPTAFDAAYETTLGPDLTRELLSFPKPSARDLLALTGPAEALRESYPEYWEGGRAPATFAAAAAEVEASLPDLLPSRREHLGTLIHFAVHTEMKHWRDPGYVEHPDQDYELLIDPCDYVSEEHLLEEGQERNQSLWADLANTAAFHAAVENAAVHRAA
ncbi:hypothetical protein [Arthrobacter sp. IK3]|uniref:hypothetical protein n=1 Tax=Arthrobacter sp. IK3 TaxID=3448169 RepID=UPI003EDF2C75